MSYKSLGASEGIYKETPSIYLEANSCLYLLSTGFFNIEGIDA